jgi:phage repressor protein C with HTH and peptisase S24 domain
LKDAAPFAEFITGNAERRAANSVVAFIPVYGHAIGGKDGEFLIGGNRVSELSSPPPAWRTFRRSTSSAESMELRYFVGETVFVNPRPPINRGRVRCPAFAGHDRVKSRLGRW